MADTLTRSRPDYAKLQQLIDHARARGVKVYPSPTPAAPWTYRYGAVSGTTGKADYDVVVDVLDELGLDHPFLVHCDCQAGTYGTPCSHAALVLYTLALHLTWADYLFLDHDQMVQGPDALREALAESEGA